MTYCINCGEQLPDKAKFCYVCGEKMDVKEKTEEVSYYAEDNSKDLSSAYVEDITEDLNPVCSETKEDVKPKIVSSTPKNNADVEEYSIPTPKQTVSEAKSTPAEELKISVVEDVEDDVEEEDAEYIDNNVASDAKTKNPVSESYEEDDVEEEDEIYPESENLSALSSASSLKNTEKKQKLINMSKEDPELESVLTDPYWDDVRPEIDNEIYQIDRSIIFKGLASVAALFIVIVYLIYMI